MKRDKNQNKSLDKYGIEAEVGYLRVRQGLFQEDMASSLGITRQQLSRIENGHQVLPLPLAVRIVWQYDTLIIKYHGERFVLAREKDCRNKGQR